MNKRACTDKDDAAMCHFVFGCALAGVFISDCSYLNYFGVLALWK